MFHGEEKKLPQSGHQIPNFLGCYISEINTIGWESLTKASLNIDIVEHKTNNYVARRGCEQVTTKVTLLEHPKLNFASHKL